MHEYRYFALSVLGIFILTLLGAYFSPTFSEQQTYLELFFMFGAVLFVFSVLVIFAAIGFSSFALFLSLFLTVVMLAFGIVGAVLVTAMTYFFWGAIFSMEVLLFYNGVDSARVWFEERYTYSAFKKEYYAFYPMIIMLYLLLEVVPHFFVKERLLKFKPHKVLEVMKEILKEK